MSAKADGSIIIDTKIDTSGIDEAMESLGKEIDKSTDGIQDVGKKVGEEFSKGIKEGMGEPLSEPLEEETQNIQSRLDTLSGSMTKFGTKSTVALTLPLTALGGKMVESAAEMNAASAQFSQVFGDLEGDAASSLGKIADDTGIVEERLKGSYTQIAAFAKTSGLDTADALELSNRAMLAVADSAAFYDRSLEETAESLRSFLKGNYENDAALGLSATETTRNAAAMELYGQSFNDLSEAQKQLTLLKMVEDANALSGALGQASRESDTWSNVTGNLNQEFTNLLGTLGQNLLPVVTPIVQFISNLLEKFGELDPGIQKIIVIIGVVVAAMGPVLLLVGGIISAISTMIPVIQAIIPVISGVVSSFSPVVLVIGAVIAAIALLIANWDKVKAVMEKFDDFLQNVFATDFSNIFGSVLGEPLNAFFANVKNIWESIKKIFSGIINFITGVFTGDWKKAWNGVKDIFAGVFGLFESIIKTPINGVIGLINGLIGGIVDGINLVIGALNNLKFDVPDWVPGIGGSTMGFNIPKVDKIKIPYLATGAVIPPNAPFMAILGDQKRGTNIEAPLSTIESALDNVLNRRGGASGSMTLHNVMQVNRRTLYEEVIEEAKLRQTVSGRNPFELA